MRFAPPSESDNGSTDYKEKIHYDTSSSHPTAEEDKKISTYTKMDETAPLHEDTGTNLTEPHKSSQQR